MVGLRLLGLLVLASIGCTILNGQDSTQNSAAILNSIAKTLKKPQTKIPFKSNSRSTVFVNTATVPSGLGQDNFLTLVWVVFPRDSVTIRVCRVNKIGPANDLYETFSPKDALALVNGGFYGYDTSHRGIPIGLRISGATLYSKIASWASGGILFVEKGSNIQIIPIAKKNRLGTPTEAVQSKPLLFENGLRAVKRDRSDQPFNRCAIGLTTNGDLFIVGAFKDDNQALTLYDFGKVLELLSEEKQLHIQSALNLDGATDAHFHVISPTKHWGYEGSNYVPDVLAIVPR